MEPGTASTRPSATGETAEGAKSSVGDRHGDAGERYELIEEIGRGAMGTVWLARDRSLDREVAVKLLHERYLSASHQQQLTVEARAMARLSHPNVVAVYDVGEREGRAFIAMELVRGKPLSAWLATPRPWREVVAVFRAVGAGLAAAHAKGLVHRDVKPSNILFGDDGRPRLADFGVAHVSRTLDEPATTATTTAGAIGSPAYMPPERLIGDAAGARGDQFGFCAAFYEALHGRRPFLGGTTSELVGAIQAGPPPPLRPVPRWLHAVVARGLAADAASRFGSMDELLAALRAGPRRRAMIAATAVLGAALAIGGVTVAATRSGGGATESRVATVAVVDAAAVVAPPVAPPVASAAVIDAALVIDAADPVEAAEPIDAGPSPDPARDATRRASPPPPDPVAGLSPDEVRARYAELNGAWKDAIGRDDLREARAAADRAIPYGRRLGNVEPVSVSMAMSCRLGDERRARATFAMVPRDATFLREEIVRSCRRHGLELGDLLE